MATKLGAMARQRQWQAHGGALPNAADRPPPTLQQQLMPLLGHILVMVLVLGTIVCCMRICTRLRPHLRKRIKQFYGYPSRDERRAAKVAKAAATGGGMELAEELSPDVPLVTDDAAAPSPPQQPTPQQSTQQQTHGIALVERVLNDLRLDKYVRAFEKAGYDDWPEILAMEGEDFDMLVVRTGIAPNHADRLQTYIRRCRLAKKLQLESADFEESCVLL